MLSKLTISSLLLLNVFLLVCCKKDKHDSSINAAPIASNIIIAGTLEVGKELSGSYTYSDPELDSENGTTFQWYIAADAAGANEMLIAGATDSTYTLSTNEEGKYIRLGVTPKSSTGTRTGTEVKSAWLGAVGEATTVTFIYNGQTVTYGIIISSVTGKKWMDRNLGAPKTPTAFNDYENYGDLFQWGRGADGHQLIARNGNTDELTVGSDTSSTLSTSDNPGHSSFILSFSSPADWRNPQNRNLWQGIDGVNNPCPAGWRIPTSAEWDAESITTDGFEKLKLTLGGGREPFSGTFSAVGILGGYWSASFEPLPSNNFHYFEIASDGAGGTTASGISFNYGTAFGYSCRCIKE